MQRRRIQVPARKLQRFRELCERARGGEVAAWRSALGLLASCSLALQLAPLVGRWLRERSEETGVPDAATALPRLDGRDWHAEALPVVELVCDASDRAYGGHVLHSSWRSSVRFTRSEDASMAAQHVSMSSTVREVRAARLMLAELLRARWPGVRGGVAGCCLSVQSCRIRRNVFWEHSEEIGGAQELRAGCSIALCVFGHGLGG